MTPQNPQAPFSQPNNTAKIVLVVLACVLGGGILLVGVLAAILFPVFQKVRGNAQLSSCLSNVRQIELGLTMYAQDHNGNLPPSADEYRQALSVTDVDKQIFHCPTDKDGASDYAMNANLQGKNLDKIPHPNKVILVYEGENQTFSFRHNGRAVVGFADGHDRTMTKEQAKEWSQTQDLKWKP